MGAVCSVSTAAFREGGGGGGSIDQDSVNSIGSGSMSKSVEWRNFPSSGAAKSTFEKNGTLRMNASDSELELRLFLDEHNAQVALCTYAVKNSLPVFNELSCWFEIEEYKIIESEDYRKTKGLYIYETFLDNVNAPFLLSMNAVGTLADIMGSVIYASLEDNAPALSSRFFDQLQLKCFEAIHDHLFLQFCMTHEYSQLDVLLDRRYNRARVQDFTFLEKLGEGGYGIVVRCQRKSTGQQYAMKIQRKKKLLHSHRRHLENVCLEMRILASCQHPFIINLAYAFQTPMLVMTVCSLSTSGDIQQLLSAIPERRLDEDVVRFYTAEVVLAIHFLHQRQFIYRDLKPNNILLNGDGHIQLLDMGGVADLNLDRNTNTSLQKQHMSSLVSKEIYRARGFEDNAEWGDENSKSTEKVDSDPRLSGASHQPLLSNSQPGQQRSPQPQFQIVGTLVYMAPEMVVMLCQHQKDRTGYTSSVDWWSLGMTMFKMITGQRPFHDDAFQELVEVSHTMENLVRRHGDFPIYSKLFQKIDFPDYLSDEAVDILKQLLNVDPKKRLGTGPHGFKNLKDHPFFSGINWDQLESKRVKPPPVLVTGKYHRKENEAAEEVDMIPKTFEETLKLHNKLDWIEDTIENRLTEEEQLHFNDWNFTSQHTVRLEAGLSRAQAQYQQSYKARQVLGPKKTGGKPKLRGVQDTSSPQAGSVGSANTSYSSSHSNSSHRGAASTFRPQQVLENITGGVISPRFQQGARNDPTAVATTTVGGGLSVDRGTASSAISTTSVNGATSSAAPTHVSKEDQLSQPILVQQDHHVTQQQQLTAANTPQNQ